MNTKVKIGLIILVIGIFSVIGWFIWWNKKEITIQPENLSCQSELMKKQADSLGLSCEEFNIISASVYEYFFDISPTLESWEEFPILYRRISELEDKQGLIVIRAKARFMQPSPSITVSFYNNKVYLISL